MAGSVDMVSVWISVGLSLAGFFASVGASTYLRGRRDGMVDKDIEYIKRDVSNLMRYFKLTPAEEWDRKRRH